MEDLFCVIHPRRKIDESGYCMHTFKWHKYKNNGEPLRKLSQKCSRKDLKSTDVSTLEHLHTHAYVWYQLSV